jgi:hypothetical protein
MATTEPRARRSRWTSLEAWQIVGIYRLAQRPPGLRDGTIKAWAERADLPYGSVATMIHRARRGCEPRSWTVVRDALSSPGRPRNRQP